MRKTQPKGVDLDDLCAGLDLFRVPAALLDKDRRRFRSWNQSFLDLVELARDEIAAANAQAIFSFSPVPRKGGSGTRIMAAVIRNPSSARTPKTIIGSEHRAIRGGASLILAHNLASTSPAFNDGQQKGATETSQTLHTRLAAAITSNLEKLTPLLRDLLEAVPSTSPQVADIKRTVLILQKMQEFVQTDFEALFVAGPPESP
ncbi:MAG TPA: hypothetical protein VGD78_19240 [Chthoniobacterales bacterium]